MNLSLKYIAIIILLSLYGCVDSIDSQVSGGKFTVHFSDVEDKPLATAIVGFWKENALMTEKKQDVKLVHTDIGYDLYLISPTRKNIEALTFEELKALTELHSKLQREVFKENELSVVITDDQFTPLFRPQL